MARGSVAILTMVVDIAIAALHGSMVGAIAIPIGTVTIAVAAAIAMAAGMGTITIAGAAIAIAIAVVVDLGASGRHPGSSTRVIKPP